jgi:WD40 repeat protein
MGNGPIYASARQVLLVPRGPRTSPVSSLLEEGRPASKSGAHVGFLIVGLCAYGGAAACTLMDSEFQPAPLQLALDGGLISAEGDAGRTPTDPSGPESGACTPETQECSGSIALLDPEVTAPATGTLGSEASDAGTALPEECPAGAGEFGSPERVTGLGVDEPVYGPTLSADGTTLYFATNASGSEQLYVARRDAPGSTAFSRATELASPNSGASDGTPFLASDGSLYFFSTRAGGLGNLDLWRVAPAADANGFGTPALVPGVNSASSDLLPSLTPDGLRLSFVSLRPGGRGGADIYQATRSSTSANFGQVVNVTALNSAADEGRVLLSADTLRAVFSSSRPGPIGSWDIWEATRPDTDAEFSELRNLSNVNSPEVDQDVALSGDERELFFVSTRGGESELWHSVREGCP